MNMENFNIDNIEIEEFEIKHISDVTEIHSQVLDGWSMKSLIGDIANDSTRSYVAVYEGRAVAFCSFLVIDDAELIFVCTHQSYRKLGIANRLLDSAIRALPVGINSIVLEVRSKNDAAISLYEKMGFDRLGTRRGFYSMPADDAVVMELSKGGVMALN